MRQFCNIARKTRLGGHRSYATLDKAPEQHGFRILQNISVPEFELVATQLFHDKTGAEHLHITRQDKNNVFAIGFGTPSMDSTGVAHILEHTTLCGSRKYPVRDPFFKMLNRSYANFMNAFTSQDNTFYPFATTNPTDYKNLQSVYLDSTLDPLLRELDFRQEGWRLEHVDPRDPSTPITFKGIVFNEMKGVMSDAGSLYFDEFQKHMYPGTIYGCNSGGNPLDIPALTFDGLKNFHKAHYHPSNAKTFTYGDIPLEQHLSILNERFDQFSPLPRTDFSQSAPRFTSLQRVETTCPLDPLTDPKKQNVTSISFHTNELSDGYFEHFALNVLVALLTDGHSSPLRQALLDTNIGTDWSPNSGHHAFGKTAFVAFGVQGVQEGDEALVEAEILRVLSEVAETGFNPDRIEGVLHQMELGLKHKSAHFGTNLMWKATSSWFDGVDPIEILQWNSRINKLRQEIAVGPFFHDMIKKHFLDNPSRLILTMRPDPDFDEKFKTKEKKLLSEKLDALSETDKTKLYEDGLSLLEAQEKPDDLSSLPTLTVRDIPRISPHYPLSRYDINEIRTYWRTTPTNGITYFKAVTTLTNLPNYLRPYLPLFADALSSLGTTQKSASEFEDEINLKTDGLRCSVLVNTLPDSLDKVSESLVISGACLDKNIPAMYSLLREFIYETNWDNEKKLESLIKNNASGVVNSIASAGSQFAEAYASSKLTPSRASSEIIGGMTQIRLLCQLAKRDNYSDVIAKLKEIAKIFLSEEFPLRVAVTCGSESRAENRDCLSQLLLPRKQKFPQFCSSPLGITKAQAFFTLPYSVNYTALAVKGVPYTHEASAILSVLAKFIEQKRVHPEIREKGGAYGGSVRYNALDGIFSFSSYRDPSFERSLQIMQEAGEWVLKQEIDGKTLGEMKLSIFKDLDSPISVQQEGMARFLHGITRTMGKRWRRIALRVTAEQVKEVAKTYLVDAVRNNLTSQAVLGEINATILKNPEWEKFDFDMSLGEEQEQASQEASAAGLDESSRMTDADGDQLEKEVPVEVLAEEVPVTAQAKEGGASM